MHITLKRDYFLMKEMKIIKHVHMYSVAYIDS